MLFAERWREEFVKNSMGWGYEFLGGKQKIYSLSWWHHTVNERGGREGKKEECFIELGSGRWG